MYWKKRYDEDDPGVFVTPYYAYDGEVDIRATVKVNNHTVSHAKRCREKCFFFLLMKIFIIVQLIRLI